MADAEQLKQQLCEFGRRAYDKGLVAASDGNLSVRLDQDQILCSPTSQCKGFLKPEDICTVDLDGNHIAGDARPTSEIRLHLEVYRRRNNWQLERYTEKDSFLLETVELSIYVSDLYEFLLAD